MDGTTDALVWLEFFSEIEDPRRANSVEHSLTNILVITLLAVLCAADDFVEVESFAEEKQDWLGGFLDLSAGVPSHDTFRRVFSLLDPDQLGAALTRWGQALAEATGRFGPGEVLAIDGKTLRRSFDRKAGLSPLHVVSAWASECGLTLGCRACASGSGSEPEAMLELIRLLQLRKATVTIDAAGTHRQIATAIREQGGEYVLAVKGNQPLLQQALEDLFQTGMQTHFAGLDHRTVRSRETTHGRVCERDVHVLGLSKQQREALDWPGAATLAVVITRTERDGKEQWESRMFLSSLPSRQHQKIASAIRRHWTVENSLHWRLDVSFGEDQSRVRDRKAQTNLAGVRRWAVSLLRSDQGKKIGAKAKRRVCGWNPDYLLSVLAAGLH